MSALAQRALLLAGAGWSIATGGRLDGQRIVLSLTCQRTARRRGRPAGAECQKAAARLQGSRRMHIDLTLCTMHAPIELPGLAQAHLVCMLRPCRLRGTIKLLRH